MAQSRDRELTAHLLRRFGLGASEAELDYYGAQGYEAAVDRLLDFESVPDPIHDVEANTLRNEQGNLPVPIVQGLVYSWLVATQRPLPHKMMLFWHDHFAVSASKVTQSFLMSQHFETLYQGSLGSFPELLESVSKDPAMIFWLDTQENTRQKPNENFAREVMELFTLGIGHYTEADIQQAARAFTGWSIQRQRRDGQPAASYRFIRGQHDNGQKTILGKTGNFSGEDVLTLLVEHPRTAVHLTEKLWKWFVHPDPDPAVIERHAARFRQSGMDIRAWLKGVMLSPEFRSEASMRAVVKSPIDFCVPTMRALGLGQAVQYLAQQADTPQAGRRVLLGVVAARATKSQGMEVMFPPDVAGWDGGPAWITSATIVERIKWAESLFQAGGRGGAAQAVSAGLGPIFIGSTPEQAAEKLCSLFDYSPSPEDLSRIAEGIRSAAPNRITLPQLGNALTSGARLIFGAPAFQMA